MTYGQQPTDRPVARHSSITEPSWLPRHNSFDSGYSKFPSHDASEHGSSEFTDDYYLALHSPADVPEAVTSHVSCGFASAGIPSLIHYYLAS